MLLSCQEQMLPGATLLAKWDFARRAGFEAIELRGKGDLAFRDRVPELRQAKAAGVVMPTVCVEMSHFIGDFDADRRRDAITNMASQLSVIAELEGVGAMTPASWGMFSYRLPPFVPPRSAEEDRKVLLEALNELGEHAEREGVVLLLEPLNRYEDHMVNRLDHAIELIKATDCDGVRVGADTYHMNIEEAEPMNALREAAPWLGHVQISDSNRLEPGAGHLDWKVLTATLAEIGYTGSLAVECRLSGPPEEVLPTVPPLFH
ncbi:sugar phosphate isomerase/epimerase [Allokutzneria multivorans]|uniref:Sugar phosphate isomerase/epimerase n=1 Tax=Allokutzneria multivorans TaxID=1142134 RepID=A0ABP7SUJ2_9PSEU